MLDIVDVKRSTYYSVLKPVHISPQVTAVNERILELYLETKGILGYRQMTYLLHQEGIKINRETIRKRMRKLGLKTKLRAKNANRLARKKWGEETNAPNLLERNFKMDHPDQAYVTEVTEWRLASKIRVVSKPLKSCIVCTFNQPLISDSVISTRVCNDGIMIMTES